jgi:hypothetical protein
MSIAPSVTPAKAGAQPYSRDAVRRLGPGLRRGDDKADSFL